MPPKESRTSVLRLQKTRQNLRKDNSPAVPLIVHHFIKARLWFPECSASSSVARQGGSEATQLHLLWLVAVTLKKRNRGNRLPVWSIEWRLNSFALSCLAKAS